MKAILFSAGLIVSGFALAAPASAAPANALSAVSAPPSLTLVQYEPHHDRHHYIPGHRYHSAPHGWHRFDHRPDDWRVRGCVLVGPIWFCP